MQHRYVGDIGDLGKYVLLRAIAAGGLRLGINWCLNTLEEDNRDGGFTGYLWSDKWGLRDAETEVFDTLKRLVEQNKRNVRAVSQAGLFPGAKFFEGEMVAKHTGHRDCASLRNEWLEEALTATRGTDVVFFDPDNGIHVDPSKKHLKKSVKYIFRDELQRFLHRRQSVVIYQHQTRQGNLQEQVDRGLESLASLEHVSNPYAITFHRQQARIYFVLPMEKHEHRLRPRTELLLSGPLGRNGTFRKREYAPVC